MRVQRSQLTILFNQLYDTGDDEVIVRHPASDIGELFRFTFDEPGESTLRFTKRVRDYTTALREIEREHPERVASDFPSAQSLVRGAVASGAIPLANTDDLAEYVGRYGDPDLTAGHPPVVAGFDTNLLPWRIDRILGLRDPDGGVGYVNGFVLATGVRDELTWDYKCYETRSFEDAFGPEFEEYWNQPLGDAREGRLGLLTYRDLRDIQTADETESERGDDPIIAAYDQYNRANRKQIILFSNDRTFVERAHSHTLLCHWVEFPDDLPRTATVSWSDLERLLYVMTILFGVLVLPKVTVYGVWRGKEELDWQHERLKLDCRSPVLEEELKGALTIAEAYAEYR